jgi:hypothetical protein
VYFLKHQQGQKGQKNINGLIAKKIKKEIKPNSKKYDWLRLNEPDAGGYCAKLRGEFTMYNSFSGILFLFSIWSVWPCITNNYSIRDFIVLFILGVLMAYRGYETENTMRKSVENFYVASSKQKNNPLT